MDRRCWTNCPGPDGTQAKRGAILQRLDVALRTGDRCTYRHSSRLIGYAEALGRTLGLSGHALGDLQWGAFLHDIGKLQVHERILNKPGRLSEAEWHHMRRHPHGGYRIVQAAGLPSAVTAIVLGHHEWYDGTGYPFGLAGPQISLGARICAVVDTLDALTSLRPYRDPVGFEEAAAAIEAESGSHFDPLIVEAFLSLAPAGWARLQSREDRRLPALHWTLPPAADEPPARRASSIAPF
jgi:putative nucleotidyltransferase with HDIG domain